MTDRFWYTESQGEKRDAEILQRYRVIIDYFLDNVERVAESKENFAILGCLHDNDEVLRKASSLKDRLYQGILNSEKVMEIRKKPSPESENRVIVENPLFYLSPTKYRIRDKLRIKIK